MPPPYSPKATPPRSATSRLLAMKFMNRLGPADSTPMASSPLASGPSTPTPQKTGFGDSSGDDEDSFRGTPGEVDDRPSAKRRKVSGASLPASSPAAGSTVAEIEATMRASMEDEERRRQVAIKKRAAELGDEHWTLDAALPAHVAAKLASNAVTTRSMTPYSIVHVGFAEIDERMEADHASNSISSNTSYPQVASNTKPRIMRFNMKNWSQASGRGEDSSEDTDEAAQEESQRSEIKGSRKRSRSDIELHKKKDSTKLKHLTSLSSQGGQSAMKCHRCGRPGHKAVNCPSEQKKRGSRKR